jgi:glycosyltransferase involved in cell wall biosynthesis
LNERVLASLLSSHPNWHFLSVGPREVLPLPNAHTFPWVPREELASFIQNLDVGFTPYDCYHVARFHGVPLKLFEYFAFGLPVVSTPLVELWEYKDLIYLGDTAEELASAVEKALREPPDSPKRAARIEIARKHSLQNLSATLRESLPLGEPRVS